MSFWDRVANTVWDKGLVSLGDTVRAQFGTAAASLGIVNDNTAQQWIKTAQAAGGAGQAYQNALDEASNAAPIQGIRDAGKAVGTAWADSNVGGAIDTAFQKTFQAGSAATEQFHRFGLDIGAPAAPGDSRTSLQRAIDDFTSPENWQKAWHASDPTTANSINMGTFLAENPVKSPAQDVYTDSGRKAVAAEINNSGGYKFATGVTNLAGAFLMDPSKGLGAVRGAAAAGLDISREAGVIGSEGQAAFANKMFESSRIGSQGTKDALEPGGGATLNSKTGENIGKGYAVSVEGHTVLADPNEWAANPAKARADISNYLTQKADLFASNPNLHLGIWHDPESGKIYLDPSEVVADPEQAKKLGVDRNQIAVYDLGKNQEIPTGGTGEATATTSGDVQAPGQLGENVGEAEGQVHPSVGGLGAKQVGSIGRNRATDFATALAGRGLSPNSYLSSLDRFIGLTEKDGKGLDAAGLLPVFNMVDKHWGNETSGILLDLYAKAGGIDDEAMRLATKRNILLTGMGSDLARDQLIADMPHIARAMERQLGDTIENADIMAQMAGKSFHDPDFHLSDYAEKLANTPGNQKELEYIGKSVDGFTDGLRKLDDTAVTGSEVSGAQRAEKVGLTRIQATYARLQQEVGSRYTFQHGPGSRTLHYVSWATGRVAPGSIDISDPVVGAEQLANTLKTSKAMDGARIRQITNGFIGADPTDRQIVVENAMKEMSHNIGRQYGFESDEADAIAKVAMSHLGNGRRFAAKQLAKSSADNLGRITIDDFNGSAIQVNKPLFSTHLANSTPALDPRVMHKLYRHHADDPDSIGVAQKALNKGHRALDMTGDLADAYTNLWRLGVLGRPGLGVRALLDTQLRSAATIGAGASLMNAFKGVAHSGSLTRYVDRPATLEEIKMAGQLRQESAHWRTLAQQLDAQTGRFDGAENPFTKNPGAEMRGILKQNPYPIGDKKAFGTLEKRDMADTSATAASAKAEKFQAKVDEAKTDKQAETAQARLERALARHEMWMEREATARAKVDQITKQYGKSVKAESNLPMNQSKVDLLNERADRLEALATELENGGGEQYKNILGQAKEYKVGGEKVNFAAYPDARRADNTQIMLGQNTTPSSYFAQQSSKFSNRIRAQLNNWHDVKPEDRNWTEAYLHSTDAMRNSVTARKVMQMADIQDGKDMLTFLRKDPSVQAEYKRIAKLENVSSFDQWASGVIDLVRYYAPKPEARQALLNGARMSRDDVNAMFPTVADRFHVHSPHMDHLKPSTAAEWLSQKQAQFFQAILDKPDMMMVKHPTYVSLYEKHVRQLLADYGSRLPEGEAANIDALQAIDRVARNRAVNGVKQIMYDTRHYTRADMQMRFVAPFIRPWEDAMKTWSKIIYNDPSVLGKMMITWNAPETMNWVVDDTGQKVNPWGNGGKAVKAEYIVLPIKIPGIGDFRIRKDAFNSITQGSVPWLPGFGPVVQVPAQALMPRIFPMLHDPSNPILQSLFLDGEAPKGNLTDIVASQMPSAARALWQAGMIGPGGKNTTQYALMYQADINQQIINAREAGRPVPSPLELDRHASAAARNAGIIKAVASGFFGLTGNASPESQFYLEQMQTLRAAEPVLLKTTGMSATQAFNLLHPEAADLNWSISVNDTGVNATVKAESTARKYADLIDKYPTYGGLIVGDDNVGGPFSRSAYDAQFTRGYGPQGSSARNTKSPQQILQDAQVREGWFQYNKINALIDTELARRGLSSIQQTNANDLQLIKANAVEGLRAQNSAWSADYDKAGSTIPTFASDAMKIANEPGIKNRPDIVALRSYLTMRQEAHDALKVASQNMSGQALKDYRFNVQAYLYEYGAKLAKSSLGFDTNAWQGHLEREFKFNADQQAVLAQQGASQ